MGFWDGWHSRKGSEKKWVRGTAGIVGRDLENGFVGQLAFVGRDLGQKWVCGTVGIVGRDLKNVFCDGWHCKGCQKKWVGLWDGWHCSEGYQKKWVCETVAV